MVLLVKFFNDIIKILIHENFILKKITKKRYNILVTEKGKNHILKKKSLWSTPYNESINKINEWNRWSLKEIINYINKKYPEYNLKKGKEKVLLILTK
jgi:hypothetical protein